MITEHTVFTEHTVESAPPAARRSMAATTSHFGYLPSAVARMATSPDLLDGFLKLNAMFEGTTLDPIAREVVIMTIATRNGCHLCVAMHTARLTALDADAVLIAALRDGRGAGGPAPGRDPGVHAAGARHVRRRGGRRAAGVPGARLHRAERA